MNELDSVRGVLYRAVSCEFQNEMYDNMRSLHNELAARLGVDGPRWLQQTAQRRDFLRIEAAHDGLCSVLTTARMRSGVEE